jgi:hypothetical protein
VSDWKSSSSPSSVSPSRGALSCEMTASTPGSASARPGSMASISPAAIVAVTAAA